MFRRRETGLSADFQEASNCISASVNWASHEMLHADPGSGLILALFLARTTIVCQPSRSSFYLEGGLSPDHSAPTQGAKDSAQGILGSSARFSFSLAHRTSPLTISRASGSRPLLPPYPTSPTRSQKLSSGRSFGLKKSDLIVIPRLVNKPTVSIQPFEVLSAMWANREHIPQSLS